MSLYDDEDLGAPPTELAVGWSSGLKILQSQKKSLTPSRGPPKATFTPTLNKSRSTFTAPKLAPVIDLKTKRPIDEVSRTRSFQTPDRVPPSMRTVSSSQIAIQSFNEPNFLVNNEYDPQWPNEYNKVILEMRGEKSKEDEQDDTENRKRRYTEEGRSKARDRFTQKETSSSSPSGFGRKPRMDDDYSDEDDIDDRDRNRGRGGSRRSTGSTSSGGAAIAPPPSLTETSSPASSSSPTPLSSPSLNAVPPPPTNDNSLKKPGLGVAAKIMAKYGYKQGLGLGRNEQGMSQALSVEKTSRRGGRIVHEKDLMPPPMFGESFKVPNSLLSKGEESTPPQIDDTDEYGDPIMKPGSATEEENNKPSITDLMKNPSKVVVCQNMVGPGEVDDDLEPEIKEECNTKYGDVQSVVIFEIPNVAAEDAVRIFVEFKRVESAIKAVVDLNGRFFGGREVRASFYDVERFKSYNLND